MNAKKLIAIYDRLANDIVGPITIHKSDASAIRLFSDVASHPDSQVAKHIEDYELIEVGTISEEMVCTTALPDGHVRVILTGTQWFEARKASEGSPP